MEFDELKSIWDNVIHEDEEKGLLEREGIRSLISKKSDSAIAKISRTIKFKLFIAGIAGVLTLPLSILAIIYGFKFYDGYTPLQSGITLLLLSFIVLTMTWLNFRSYLKIQLFQGSSEDVLTTLKKVIALMENFMKVNIYSDAMFTPILTSVIVGHKLYQSGSHSVEKLILFVIATAVLTFLLSNFINRRTMKLKFGSYMNTLRDCVHELESIEKSKDQL